MPRSEAKVASMSIVHENQWVKGEMLVNMAFLAVVACSAVNGVAAIHSQIVIVRAPAALPAWHPLDSLSGVLLVCADDHCRCHA